MASLHVTCKERPLVLAHLGSGALQGGFNGSPDASGRAEGVAEAAWRAVGRRRTALGPPVNCDKVCSVGTCVQCRLAYNCAGVLTDLVRSDH